MEGPETFSYVDFAALFVGYFFEDQGFFKNKFSELSSKWEVFYYNILD